MDPNEIRVSDYKGLYIIDEKPTNALEVTIDGVKKYVIKVDSDLYEPLLQKGQLIIVSRSQLGVVDTNTPVKIKNAKGCPFVSLAITGGEIDGCGNSPEDSSQAIPTFTEGFILRDLDGKRLNTSRYSNVVGFGIRLRPGQKIMGSILSSAKGKSLFKDEAIIKVEMSDRGEYLIEETISLQTKSLKRPEIKIPRVSLNNVGNGN